MIFIIPTVRVKTEQYIVCFRSMAERSGNFIKVHILQFCLFKAYPLFFSVGEKFRWFFENIDHDKTEYLSSEVCELIER